MTKQTKFFCVECGKEILNRNYRKDLKYCKNCVSKIEKEYHSNYNKLNYQRTKFLSCIFLFSQTNNNEVLKC
jgi:DNA-directed RNA polymerase subunit RPC12/RpoP